MIGRKSVAKRSQSRKFISCAPDDSYGIRLFGVPYDWGYAGRPPKLFMQYDPLDTDMPFMQEIDGFLYFFYDKDITQMTLHIERT